MLEEGEKETYLISSGVWAVPAFSVSDEDSTRTPPTYGPHHVMKAAARLWHLLDGKVHEAWKKRAVRLNMVPLPGTFRSFPKEISKKPRISGNKLLEELVFDSLKCDWEMVCKVIKSSITCHPRVVDSQRKYKVGREMVVIQNQVFWNFHMNKLLNNVLFGYGYAKLYDHEIVHKSKKQIVIHIASRQRMTELFSLNGLVACSQARHGMMFTCCGKVGLVNSAGQSIIGYIMQENNNSLSVLLENNAVVSVDRPIYDSSLGSYVYNIDGTGEYSVSQYWPIRFRLNHSGKTFFLLNRVVLRKEKIVKSYV